MKVSVQLFGAFRPYLLKGELVVETRDGVSIKDFKDDISEALKKIEPEFKEDELLRLSAVATEDEILQDSRTLTTTQVALLPPVCGG